MDGGASGCKAFCHRLDSYVILLYLCCQCRLPLCIKMVLDVAFGDLAVQAIG
jgi:hypothetical protein